MRALLRSRNIKGAFCVTAYDAFFEQDAMRFAYHFDKYGVAGNIDSGGTTEPITRAKANEFLNTPDAVFFDIGAHEGLFSISAKRANPALKVYAFEPQPAELRENLQLNDLGSVEVVAAAVGERAGSVSMTTDERSSNHVTDTNSGSIPVVALDDQDLPAPTLMKLDIEGFELSALKGATNILKTNRPIVITEINHCFLRYNKDLLPLHEFMEAHGYRMQALRDGSLVPIDSAPASLEALPGSAEYNYWWTPT